jgi:hypothetical protein
LAAYLGIDCVTALFADQLGARRFLDTSRVLYRCTLRLTDRPYLHVTCKLLSAL